MKKLVACLLISPIALASCLVQQKSLAQVNSVCLGEGNSGLPGGCAAVLGRRSLTVIGQGLVKAPADTALMEFRFSSRGSSEGSEDLSIQTARQFTEDALKPAIDALQKAGISTANITLQTGSVQNPKLLVKVDKPTQENLQKLVQIVDRSLKSKQQIFLQSIGASYSVNSCELLERTARRTALQDAQKQLITLAQDVRVELGELISVTVLPMTGASASIGCGTKVGVPTSPLSFAAEEATPPYNPSDKPEVQVKSQVSVTHAIKTKNKPSMSGGGQ